MKPTKQAPADVQSGSTTAEELRALATRFQRLLERERTRLAQELHDNLTQKLTVISLELSLMDGSIASESELPRTKVREKIKELSGIVGDMIQSLRELKAQLRPKLLDEFGLVAALEWDTEDFGKKTGLQCLFHAHQDEVALPAHVATELFRMFREIMSNVAEHAEARRVDVELSEEEGQLIIRVRDDGKGITLEQSASPKSVGLLELRERATALGGTLEIGGAPGSGTKVAIAIPLGNRASARKSVKNG